MTALFQEMPIQRLSCSLPSVRLHADLDAELRALAALQQKPLVQVMRNILYHYLQVEEELMRLEIEDAPVRHSAKTDQVMSQKVSVTKEVKGAFIQRAQVLYLPQTTMLRMIFEAGVERWKRTL
ncbi:TPA: hypothetical protein ACOEOO_001859 [Stenotrophomonas maltophilia]|uniref:hypothetical protein n=1 Tax=Stenotrophomonas maltophilia group TaxID=995085 RepID=UPI001120BCD3|nr:MULTISPECIES: hypothetical protein [Stenotrophomonas maltophilia group]MDH2038287.1 hypothetical protein [Stenotrophomonas maltophilia]MDT3488691.1 hypothetical protein [Stenotrophomonas maltophilia group sp. msm4]TNY01983.1 hypothetical protein FIU09_01865 [Stenotrophomonas maltophilia]TPD81644.1 hypothetical protein FJN21_00660 [Stenotrophomonas maltophilia]TPD83149.1 hypothetical protein FJN20_09465 [Stenotrophomonas maltophilia]